MYSHVCHPCIHSHMRRESSLRVTPIMPVPLLRALALVDKTPTTHLAVTHQVAPCTYTCTIHMHRAHTHAPCTTLGMLHSIVQAPGSCIPLALPPSLTECMALAQAFQDHQSGKPPRKKRRTLDTQKRPVVGCLLDAALDSFGYRTHTVYGWCICVM